jgi:hypothetical protein
LGVWRHLDKIEAGLSGEIQRLINIHDAVLFSLMID